MSDGNQERRHFTRVTFDGETFIEQGQQRWPATLIDLSLRGLLVETPEHFDADTSEAMEAVIHLADELTIRMTVNWRHTENGQSGFQCNNIDLDSIQHLRRLVELNIGDSTLLERELAALGGE